MVFRYLDSICTELSKKWPDNKTINIVCHGHSVPSGYFATPFVDTFHSYPHLLHKSLKEKFPFAVINVIVTAIGGENSTSGLARFDDDVLSHKPSIVTIDYGLNDRSLGAENARKNLQKMIEKCKKKDVLIILLTPSLDQSYFEQNFSWTTLKDQAIMIRELAKESGVAVCDTFDAMLNFLKDGKLSQILSHVNHPNFFGHQIIANELDKLFLAK